MRFALISLAFAGARAGTLQLRGPTSGIEFGAGRDQAVVTATCKNYEARVSWMTLGTQEVHIDEINATINNIVHLENVAITCAGAGLTTPCVPGVEDELRPAMFYCNYDGGFANVSYGPYNALRSADTFQGQVVGMYVTLECPPPLRADVFSIINPNMAHRETVTLSVVHAGTVLGYQGPAGANTIEYVGLPGPATPPPPPSPPNPPMMPGGQSNCSDVKAMGHTESGRYNIMPRGRDNSKISGSVVRTVYCDMSTDPPGQSIFVLPTGTHVPSSNSFPSKVCTMTYSVDDMDNTMMGPDLAGLVQHYGSTEFWHPSWTKASRTIAPTTSGTGWTRTNTNLWTLYPDIMPDNPTGSNSYASMQASFRYGKPVPFPYAGTPNGIMVFFTTENIYFKIDDTNYAFAYPTGFSTYCKGYTDSTYNWAIYITDGVSSVGIYRRNNNFCAEVLDFDWAADTYTAAMITRRAGVSVPTWPTQMYDTEEDFMGGDLLWTVAGKPSYLAPNQFKLGTSIEDPFTVTQTDTFSCPGICSTQHGLDLFWHVDSDGYLWMADWGHDNGGFFNCGNDNQLGMGKSSVKLAAGVPEGSIFAAGQA